MKKPKTLKKPTDKKVLSGRQTKYTPVAFRFNEDDIKQLDEAMKKEGFNKRPTFIRHILRKYGALKA